MRIYIEGDSGVMTFATPVIGSLVKDDAGKYYEWNGKEWKPLDRVPAGTLYIGFSHDGGSLTSAHPVEDGKRKQVEQTLRDGLHNNIRDYWTKNDPMLRSVFEPPPSGLISDTYVVDEDDDELEAKMEVASEVVMELERAMAANGPFTSAHEGYAVILEELDELWDEVKLKVDDRDIECMREEAIQVAAMAMRFVIEVCDAA